LYDEMKGNDIMGRKEYGRRNSIGARKGNIEQNAR
jgi:hypothetical protein